MQTNYRIEYIQDKFYLLVEQWNALQNNVAEINSEYLDKSIALRNKILKEFGDLLMPSQKMYFRDDRPLLNTKLHPEFSQDY